MQHDMSGRVCIHTYPTYYYFKCDEYGWISPKVNIRRFLDRLTEKNYNPVLRMFQILYQYCFYDKVNGTLSFPINTLDEFTEYLGGNDYTIQDMGYATPRDIRITMKSKFHPKDHQVELIDFLTDNTRQFKALSAFTGSGKFSRNSALIKVPYGQGWKRMGDIQVGDLLTMPDGTVAPVTAKFPQGMKKIWMVTFEDGRQAECGREHLWSVHIRGVHKTSSGRQVIDTKELQDWVHGRHRICSIDLIRPELKTTEQDKVFPIHPYLLGVLLGDGSLSSGVVVHSDKWVIDKCESLLPQGHRIRFARDEKDAEYYHSGHIVFDQKDHPKRHIKLLLKDLGLLGTRSYEKFIPEMYFNGSWEQRMQLLQGLMDTDGYISQIGRCGQSGKVNTSGSISYSTSCQRLHTDIKRLIWSLGGKTHVQNKAPFYTYKGKRLPGRLAYIIHTRMRIPGDIFTLPRKRCRIATDGRNQYSDSHRLRVVSVCETMVKDECSCIYVDHPDHLYIVDDYIVTHNTYCTAAAISAIGHPAIILTMGLIKQWYTELLDKTHLKKHEIYVIKGNVPLRKLIDSEGYYPKVIIASIRTMSMYAAAKKIPYDSILSYPEFQKKFGIGVVAVDEVHMDFYANTLIMLRTQVKHNIFLSATYERSSPQGERIFGMIFPPEIQFGGHIVKKYTATTMLTYSFSKPLNEQAFITKDGYSHALFEAKILRDKSLREEFLKAIVNTTMDAYYLRVKEPGQKCLFICYTKDMVDAIGSYITKHYPALGLLCFYGDLDDSLITPSIDVVVSTQRKSGTGRDIKGLRVAANTMSFKSLPLAKQMMGRVREIPGTLTYYLDFYCSNLNSHQRHALKRKSRYMDLSLTFYESTV